MKTGDLLFTTRRCAFYDGATFSCGAYTLPSGSPMIFLNTKVLGKITYNEFQVITAFGMGWVSRDAWK